MLDVISTQSFFGVMYSASCGRRADGGGDQRSDLEETW